MADGQETYKSLTLGTLSISRMIKDEKKALVFHLGFLGLALVHYALTDYKDEQSESHST
jgi:hypothetical protein